MLIDTTMWIILAALAIGFIILREGCNYMVQEMHDANSKLEAAEEIDWAKIAPRQPNPLEGLKEGMDDIARKAKQQDDERRKKQTQRFEEIQREIEKFKRERQRNLNPGKR